MKKSKSLVITSLFLAAFVFVPAALSADSVDVDRKKDTSSSWFGGDRDDKKLPRSNNDDRDGVRAQRYSDRDNDNRDRDNRDRDYDNRGYHSNSSRYDNRGGYYYYNSYPDNSYPDNRGYGYYQAPSQGTCSEGGYYSY